MKILLRLAILAIFLTIYVPLQAAEPSKTYSKKQVLADIKQLVRLLKKNHPNLYAHQNSKKFKATIKRVKGKLTPKMSRLDAVVRFQQVLASVCDEHTGVIFSPKKEPSTYKSARYLESSLITRHGRIVVGNNNKSTNSEVILSIGDRSADNINEYMQSLQSQDGCLESKNHVIDGSTYQKVLFLGNYFQDIKFGPKVEYRNHSNQIVSRNEIFLNFSRISKSLGFVHTMKSIMSNIVLNQNSFSYQGKDFYRDYIDKDIQSYLYYNQSKKVYFLKLGEFTGGKKFDRLIDKSLRKIIAAKPDHVIVDLTDSPGGRILSASRLLSYFLPKAHRPARYVRVKNPSRKLRQPIVWKTAKRKKAHFKSMKIFRRSKRRKGQYRLRYSNKSFGNPDYKGKISVLVSPRTHSAATMVAAILKNKRNAKIIGYINKRSIATACFSPGGSLRLKNTRVMVDIPFTCFDRDKKTYEGQEFLKPDIVVNPMVSSSSNLGGRIIEAALKDLDAGAN